MMLCAVHLLWDVLLGVGVVNHKALRVDMKLVPKHVEVPQETYLVFEKTTKPFVIGWQAMCARENIGLILCTQGVCGMCMLSFVLYTPP